MSNLLIQIIRTVVPTAVGVLFAWLLSIGINLPEETKAEFTSFAILTSSSLYYILIAYLEKKIPAFGWLLGVAAKPVYATKDEVIIKVKGSLAEDGTIDGNGGR